MALRTISTVVEPAQGLALCSLGDVKEELKLTVTTHDGYLGKLIARCSAAIARHCNMIRLPETIQDRILLDPEAQPEVIADSLSALQLSRFPVASIVSAREAGRAITVETGCALDPAAGLLFRLGTDGGLKPWKLPVIVVFQAGEAVPQDLADAAIRLVTARWFARGRDPMLRSENVPEVGSVQYWVSASADDGAFPPDVLDLLAEYRAPVIA